MMRKLAVPFAACVHILFTMQAAGAASAIKHVFVIVMENTDAEQIYGVTKRAPYINSLLPKSARATRFNDPLPIEILSEPHYIWMEAGINEFADHKFLTDKPPSAKNSTGSTDHVVTQIKNSGTVTWMTYQENINSRTGRCPVHSEFPYAAKHNPFVFFQDVSGNPPSRDNGYCIEHTKPYSAFKADLAANRMANYVFITPNMCHNMHGRMLGRNCPKGNRVRAGDDWLKSELPRIIDWVGKNSGVIFIVWDEGEATNEDHTKKPIPFLAIGPGVKPGHESSVEYDHGSLVKSVERIFELPILPAVAGKNDFADMFKAGSFP